MLVSEAGPRWPKDTPAIAPIIAAEYFNCFGDLELRCTGLLVLIGKACCHAGPDNSGRAMRDTI